MGQIVREWGKFRGKVESSAGYFDGGTEIHLKYTRRNASLDNFVCNEVSSRLLSSRAFERVKQFVEHEPLSVFFSSHSDDHICDRFMTLVLW